MLTKVKKIRSPKLLSEALSNIKPGKLFDAKKFLNKVKWDEDPVEYQKRLRSEWD